MRLVRFTSPDGSPRLGLLQDDTVIDLLEADEHIFRTWQALLAKAEEERTSISKLIREYSRRVRGRYSYSKLWAAAYGQNPHLLIPIEPTEVWASGVTYVRSRRAREGETAIKGIYEKVYFSARPEIFFKGTYRCCVGPNERVGIRYDSNWNVAEPELAFILGLKREIIGFTAANDMSSRDLEAENPLYLPQAKIYNNSCALGPSVLLSDKSSNPHLGINLRILRDKQVAYEGRTRTSKMRRSFDELRAYLIRCNDVPPLTVCLTGTGIVPPEDFILEEGDVVEVDIDKIGVLRNQVVRILGTSASKN